MGTVSVASVRGVSREVLAEKPAGATWASFSVGESFLPTHEVGWSQLDLSPWMRSSFSGRHFAGSCPAMYGKNVNPAP